jgi:hypothetical protein
MSAASLGNVRARDAHRHADVGGLQCGRVVDPVAGHRHDCAFALQGFHDSQLVFRVDARINRNLFDRLNARVVIRHFLNLSAGDGSLVIGDAELGGDDGCGDGMIARYHYRAYPRRLRAADGFLRFCARRVNHADQSREHEVVFNTLVNFIGFKRVSG